MEANHWKTYFVFTKKERIGIVSLLAVLVITLLLPMFFTPVEKFDERNFEAFKKEVEQFHQQQQSVAESKQKNESFYSPSRSPPISLEKIELFFFNPNTLDAEGWKRLGIKDKTITTILHYINKGGKFYKPEDLSKIYGLSQLDYERLLPYVQLAVAKIDERNERKELQQNNVQKQIEINTADTSQLIRLPGIGTTLANRIIHFREKLGGFYAVEQVAETYGLPDSTFQKIKFKLVCNSAQIQKININTATLEILKAHPYIKYQVGNAVIQYRNQHGNFQSVEELKQVQAVTEELIKKIAPYITVR